MSDVNREARREGASRVKLAPFAIAGVVLVVFCLFFWPATLHGRLVILHDSWCWSFPLRSAAWESLRAGRLPLWSSGIFSGYPLFSMSQLGLAYPLTWVYALNAAWGEQVYVLAPFVIAPLFVYLYVRELGRSRAGSLLAGLSFAYGGFMASPISQNGLLPNGFLWLPLVLLAVERARVSRLIPCLIASSLSYGMAVLSGVGQGFLSAGIVAVAYGVFTWLTPRTPLPPRSLKRLNPLLVAVGGIVLGTGLGAFQVLETLQANRLSTRAHLSYATFIEGTVSIRAVLISMFDPLHQTAADVTAYVAPLVLGLAILAGAQAFFDRSQRDPLVFFWLGTLAVALLLMFGASTPLYRLAYRVPFVNLFRIPPRHAAEMTFAAAVLGSYGWDALLGRVERLKRPSGRGWSALLVGALLLAVLLVVWRWNAIAGVTERGRYLALKGASSVLILGAVAVVGLVKHGHSRAALSAGIIVLGTVSESYICLSRWWFPDAKSATELMRVAPISEHVQRLPAHANRVYSHLNAFGEERVSDRPADAPNMTARLGLHEAAGYDPMILRRYSEALGNAGMFAMPRGWNLWPDAGFAGPFNVRSRTLDLLNVTYVVRRLQPGEPIIPPDWESSGVPDRLTLDVGDPKARSYLESGFSGDESIAGRNGAWSNGSRSTVRALLRPLDSEYELKLNAMVFKAAGAVEVVVHVNKKRVGVMRFRFDWRDRSITLPRGALMDGWNEITFTYSKTVAPASVNRDTADRRKLAVFLDALMLTPVE